MLLKGRGASLGRVEGKTEFYKEVAITPGNIVLVDGPLTAEIAVELRLALGVAASKGGITSHGANVLREFGIPCLVAVEGLSQVKEGAKAILDCFIGILRIVD